MKVLLKLKSTVSRLIRESYIDNAGGITDEKEYFRHYEQMAAHLFQIVQTSTLSGMIRIIEEGWLEHCDIDKEWLESFLQNYSGN